MDAACDLPSVVKASAGGLSEAIIPILKRKVEKLEGTIKNLEHIYKRGHLQERLCALGGHKDLKLKNTLSNMRPKTKTKHCVHNWLAACAAAKAAAEGKGEVDINNKVAWVFIKESLF